MSRFSRLLSHDRVVLMYRSKLEKTLRENFLKAEAERRHRLHASLLDDDFCLRLAVYRVVNPVLKYVPTSRLLIFEDGVWRHRRWQDLLVKAKLAKRENIERPRMFPGLSVLCTPDAVIEIDGQYYIWECKGVNGEEFKRIKEFNNCPLRFVRRVHIYGGATGLRKAIVHIDNKWSTDEYLVFVFDLDQGLINEVVKRLVLLEKAYAKYMKFRVLPDGCGDENCRCREI